MKSIARTTLAIGALAVAGFANAQETCDFLSLDAVSKALPQYQPWRVAGGGTGMCRFEGEQRVSDGGSVSTSTAMLSVIQQFQATPKEATDFVRNMKAGLGKAYKPKALQGAGSESFSYADPTGSMNALSWYSHSGKMVLSGMFMPPGNQPATDEEESAVKALDAQATAGSSKPGMSERAGQCPHLDMALIRKLISAKGLKVQQFGNDSCMANDAANSVVLFSRIRFDDEVTGSQLAESKANSPCKFEQLAEFGPHGLLVHLCTVGNPHAEVFFVKGLSAYEFSVVPGKEPTAQQRADLIALAKRSFEAKQ
jgi:hypothetical protein